MVCVGEVDDTVVYKQPMALFPPKKKNSVDL